MLMVCCCVVVLLSVWCCRVRGAVRWSGHWVVWRAAHRHPHPLHRSARPLFHCSRARPQVAAQPPRAWPRGADACEWLVGTPASCRL